MTVSRRAPPILHLVTLSKELGRTPHGSPASVLVPGSRVMRRAECLWPRRSRSMLATTSAGVAVD